MKAVSTKQGTLQGDLSHESGEHRYAGTDQARISVKVTISSHGIVKNPHAGTFAPPQRKTWVFWESRCGNELVVKAVESGRAFVVKSQGVGPAPATVSRQMH